MKVSCILTSFNRPKWVRDALVSISRQTHRDFQLILIDESDEFDIWESLHGLELGDVIVQTVPKTPAERASRNCLSENCNSGLSFASGDLVCFLADDDYFYPNWFEKAVAYFQATPDVSAAYGKLVYSYSPVMSFSPNPDPSVVRWYKDPVEDPFGKLDHNQVIHRNFGGRYKWPMGAATIGGPDAHYFREIAKDHVFHPIDAFAAVKRIHRKGLMESQQIYLGGGMEGLRE